MNTPEKVAKLSLDQQRELLRKLLKQRAEEKQCFSMSVQQQSLWYEYLRDDQWPGYNVFLPARVRSPIDVRAFRAAIDQLVRRHAALRTTFGEQEGKPFQQVHDFLAPEFSVDETAELTEHELRQRVADESVRPFDLRSGPLLRIALYRCAEDDWIVLASAHHIVVDFWSLVLLLTELRQLYDAERSGRQLSLPPASNNYQALVRYQRELLESPETESLRRYWRRQLRGTAFITEFPTDFHRPDSFTGRAATVPIPFSSEVTERIFQLAQQLRVTYPSVLLAIIQTLVHRYTGLASFLIGTPFSGRLQRDFEETVGFFVNMLPLRADLREETTLVDLVRQASARFAEALQHEALPLTEIVRGAGIPRDASHSPLFQISCTFEKSHRREEEGRAGYLLAQDTQRTDLGGLRQESYSVPLQTCHHDLEFLFERSGDRLHAMLCYCRDLFTQQSMQTLATNLERLADQLLQHPNRPLADVPWAASGIAAPIQTTALTGAAEPATKTDPSPWIVTAIRQTAQRHPDRIALVGDGFSRTYEQLVSEAERFARALARREIGAGCFVPVVGNRGPQVVPAMLGVLISGAAVVPIDASAPSVQASDLLSDTKAPLVILRDSGDWNSIGGSDAAEVECRTLVELLDESVDADIPLPEVAAQDLCYLIYTSGSTGRPKGVMIEHRSIDNTLQWRAQRVPLLDSDRLLVLLSHQFDAGFGVMFGALTQGARLVWPSAHAANVDALLETIMERQITIVPAIPSLLGLMVDHPRFESCDSLRQFWTGGETMPSDLPARIRRRRNLSVWNFYGPTEAAIEACAANVTEHPAHQVVPIGFPVRDTDLLVLDSQRRLLPPGVPGEIAIAGPGLARGYLGNPVLTAQRFPTLADGRRVYLTGDRGRLRADGALMFMGRTDDQVKIGGYRIELQEIEEVLKSAPAVADAAVKIHQSGKLNAGLIAYVTGNGLDKDQATATREQIQRYLASQLSPYKRPRQIVFLEAIPRTSSGKVDRNRLPDPELQQGDGQDVLQPRTPLERYVAKVFAEMLGRPQVGIHEDFFELGGSSLQAAMFASRLCDELGWHVPTSLVFEMPNVLRISQQLAIRQPSEVAERFGSASIDRYDRPPSHEEDASETSLHPLITRFTNQPELAAAGVDTLPNPAPIFMIHPPGGIVVCYRELGRLLPAQQGFFAVRSRGLHREETLPQTAVEMAADYVEAIRDTVPHGPYQLGGWSLGGVVAWEVTRQLLQAGETVERLILLDSSIPSDAADDLDSGSQANPGLEYGLDYTLEELGELAPEEQLPLLWEHAKKLGVLDDDTPQVVVDRALEELKHLFHHHLQVIGRYRPAQLNVPVLLVRPRDVPVLVDTAADRGWSKFAPEVTVRFVQGHHHSMVKQPGVARIAELIQEFPGH